MRPIDIVHRILEKYPKSIEGRIIGWYTQSEIETMQNQALITPASYRLLSKYWSRYV